VLNIGIIRPKEVGKEIGKLYAVAFAYISFPSLESSAFVQRFYLLNKKKKNL